MESKFLTKKEIYASLGFTPHDLNKWIKAGIFPFPICRLTPRIIRWSEILLSGFEGDGYYWIKEDSAWEPCLLTHSQETLEVKAFRIQRYHELIFDPDKHEIKGPICYKLKSKR